MVNEINEARIMLKNALDAIDKADIQRAKELVEGACKALDGYNPPDEWNYRAAVVRPNDKLLKEFGW